MEQTMQRSLYLAFLLRPFQTSLEFDLLNVEFHGKIPNSILETKSQDVLAGLS